MAKKKKDGPDLARVVKISREFSRPYRIEHGNKFKLKDYDPADTAHLGSEDKPRAKEALEIGRRALAELQDKLYADNRWSVLLVFQAMDAAGKDSVIKHVMSGLNPQGCQVYSFKQPTSEELDHDYMWRCAKNLPERGRIGIFNRSHYEEVLGIIETDFLELVFEFLFGERDAHLAAVGAGRGGEELQHERFAGCGSKSIASRMIANDGPNLRQGRRVITLRICVRVQP
jgi:hypothetical protein